MIGLFDDLARGLGHQTAHTGKLADLLFRTARAGVGHDVNRVEVAAGAVVLLHGLEHFFRNAFGDLGPDFDDLVVAFAVGDRAFLILRDDFDDGLFGVADQAGLLARHDHVVDADGDAGAGRVQEPERLHLIQHVDRDRQTVLQVAILNELREALLLEQAVDERHLIGQNVVEDDAADRRVHVLLHELDRLGVHQVLAVESLGQIDDLAGVAQPDRRERLDLAHFERDQNVVDRSERAAFALGAGASFGQVVKTKHHVLRRHRDGRAVRGRQDVVRRQHQRRCFDLRFRRQRNVDGHLIAVEIGVERGAGQRVQLDRLAFDQHRLERLNAETMQRWSAIQKDRVILDDFFQNVPNHRVLLLDQFLGLLDRRAMTALFEAMIDERLEQFERHLLGQTALVEFQFRSDDDDRTARVIDALAEQVLTETALLAFERIGERLERAIVRAAQHAAAASVVEQRVDGFLQHALFIADDDVRRMQLDQLLQAVVAIDDAAIQIVQIGRRKTAAVQWDERTQFRRNHRMTSRIIHSGLLPDLRKLSATRRRLAYLSFFCCEISVFIFSRMSRLSPSQSTFLRRSLIPSAPIIATNFPAYSGSSCALALVGDDLALLEIGHFAVIDNNESLEKDAFQLAQSNVQQVADARRQALKRTTRESRAGQFDMAQAFAAHARQRNFDAALIANHAAVLHALVLAAQAFPIGDRSEDAGAKQPVALRLECPAIDGLGLGHLAMDQLRIFSGLASEMRIESKSAIKFRTVIRRRTVHDVSQMGPVSSGQKP